MLSSLSNLVSFAYNHRSSIATAAILGAVADSAAAKPEVDTTGLSLTTPIESSAVVQRVSDGVSVDFTAVPGSSQSDHSDPSVVSHRLSRREQAALRVAEKAARRRSAVDCSAEKDSVSAAREAVVDGQALVSKAGQLEAVETVEVQTPQLPKDVETALGKKHFGDQLKALGRGADVGNPIVEPYYQQLLGVAGQLKPVGDSLSGFLDGFEGDTRVAVNNAREQALNLLGNVTSVLKEVPTEGFDCDSANGAIGFQGEGMGDLGAELLPPIDGFSNTYTPQMAAIATDSQALFQTLAQLDGVPGFDGVGSLSNTVQGFMSSLESAMTGDLGALRDTISSVSNLETAAGELVEDSEIFVAAARNLKTCLAEACRTTTSSTSTRTSTGTSTMSSTGTSTGTERSSSTSGTVGQDSSPHVPSTSNHVTSSEASSETSTANRITSSEATTNTPSTSSGLLDPSQAPSSTFEPTPTPVSKSPVSSSSVSLEATSEAMPTAVPTPFPTPTPIPASTPMPLSSDPGFSSTLETPISVRPTDPTMSNRNGSSNEIVDKTPVAKNSGQGNKTTEIVVGVFMALLALVALAVAAVRYQRRNSGHVDFGGAGVESGDKVTYDNSMEFDDSEFTLPKDSSRNSFRETTELSTTPVPDQDPSGQSGFKALGEETDI